MVDTPATSRYAPPGSVAAYALALVDVPGLGIDLGTARHLLGHGLNGGAAAPAHGRGICHRLAALGCAAFIGLEACFLPSLCAGAGKAALAVPPICLECHGLCAT